MAATNNVRLWECKLRRALCFGAVLCGVAGAEMGVAASPLKLEYCVSDRPGGGFDYVFTLVLTDAEGTWRFGHSYNWIVFGDADRGESPLRDFVGEVPVPPMWEDDGFNYSSGTHNGPCLIDAGRFTTYPGWAPAWVGASISWRGYSARSLGQGELLWSSLLGTGERVYFEVANRVVGCGEVAPPCRVADFNVDGGVDGADVADFFMAWAASEASADLNNDGGVEGGDVEMFYTYWAVGGC